MAHGADRGRGLFDVICLGPAKARPRRRARDHKRTCKSNRARESRESVWKLLWAALKRRSDTQSPPSRTASPTRAGGFRISERGFIPVETNIRTHSENIRAANSHLASAIVRASDRLGNS